MPPRPEPEPQPDAPEPELQPEPEPQPQPEPQPEPEPQRVDVTAIDSDGAQSMAVLELPKERGGRFFLATDGEDVNDSLLFTIGMFRFPTAGFYGGTFPTAEMLTVVKGSSASLPGLWLPPEVRAALPDSGQRGFEFFFIISDAGAIVAQHGPTLNLIHHAWLFPTAAPGKRTMGDVDVGIWGFAGSQVGAADRRSLGYNCLSRTRVSIHPQSAKNPEAGMCCSPNNARFTVQQSQPDGDGDQDDAAAGAVPGLSFFWSVAVAPRKGCDSSAAESSKLGGRSCVTLQWLLTEPESSQSKLRQDVNNAVESCKTLEPLLHRLSHVLGVAAQHPATAARAARLTFGIERSHTMSWPQCVGIAKCGGAASAAELEELNRGDGGGRGGGRGGGGRGGGTLVCASCKLSFSSSEFSKAQRGKGERRRCKQCIVGSETGTGTA